MKTTLLLTFAISFVITTASQSLAASSLNEVIAGKQQITRYNSEKLNNLLKSDVLQFYKLDKIYDTELKQKNFFKTDGYKEKLEQLTKLRTNALNKQYYVRFEGNNKWDNDHGIYNYDIKKQGITFKPHKNFEYFYETNILDGVLFKFLPTDEYRHWFAPMDEKHGALIENNKNLIDVIITFSVLNSYGSFDVEAECPANLYLANRDTGEIYFETSCQCIKPAEKKHADTYRYVVDEDGIGHFIESDKPTTKPRPSKSRPSGWYVITDRGGPTHCAPVGSPSDLIDAAKRTRSKYSTKDDLVKNGKVYIMTLKIPDDGFESTYIRGIDLCKSVLKKVKAADASEKKKYR